MSSRLRPGLAAAILIWLALVAVGLAVRPPLPIDETRYLAVAWDMWRLGDYLVPHLNGAPYHHKPPLLFWLMVAGWHVFGVSEIWARLVAPLFGLGAVLLTWRLARMLFPDRPNVAEIAPLMVIGAGFYAVFVSLTFFDVMVTFFTVLGMIGVVHVAQGRWGLGWTLFGASIGLGILSKGPVQILDLGPAAVLAPLWLAEPKRSWARWYGAFVLALLGGGVLALAWAGPAAISGGPEFAHMLFIGQTTERVVDAMWHEQPWWWYLPIAFAVLFPWLWWPALWRSFFARAVWRESGVRFCAVILAFVFVAFSAISGKQPQYLLPMIPVFAILAARFLDAGAFVDSRTWRWPPAAMVLALAVALVVAALAPARFARVAREMATIDPAGPVGVIAAGAFVAFAAWLILGRARHVVTRSATLAAATAAALIVGQIALVPAFTPRIETAADALAVKRAQDSGLPVANINDYHGQFHFAGRLTQPIEAIYEHDAVAWAQAHPNGVILSYRRSNPATYQTAPVYLGLYRGRHFAIWRAEDVIHFGPNLIIDR